MKQKFSALFVLLALFLLFSSTSFAAETPKEIKVRVAEQEVQFPDSKPFKDDSGRVQVPVRFIGEALGAEVKWIEETSTATFSVEGIKAAFTVGSDTLIVNDKQVKMDTSALKVDGRVYAPVRFVAESLGAYVHWSESSSTVMITSGLPFKMVEKSPLVAKFNPTKEIEVEFSLDLSQNTADQQKKDLKSVLAQRWGEETAQWVVDRLEQHTVLTTLNKQKIEMKPIDAKRITVTVNKAEKADEAAKPGSSDTAAGPNVLLPENGKPLRIVKNFDAEKVIKELEPIVVKLYNNHAYIFDSEYEKSEAGFNEFVDKHVSKDGMINFIKREYVLRPVGSEYGWSDEGHEQFTKVMLSIKGLADLEDEIEVDVTEEDGLIITFEHLIEIEELDKGSRLQFQFELVDDVYVLMSVSL